MLILLSQNEQGLDLQKHIFSFGQFTLEEYVSMDATSLRKLLQRGATRMKQTVNLYQSQINSNDSVHTSSAVALVFESRSGQSKDYNISS
jgi:hypothetical protein